MKAKNFRGKRLLVLVLCPLLLVLSSCAEQTASLSYSPSEEAFVNPYMGLAAWATENPENLRQEISLVYVDVTWAELEPERGEPDFAALEERCQFAEWKSRGLHAIFRLVLDEPNDEAHMDIPQWLYDMTGDGEFYDISYGKGYCPNYENPVLMEEHARLLSLLGERYGEDSFIAFVELGSVGHWGEWHIHEDAGSMPLMAVCEEYFTPYLTAFPNAFLMMRRPFAFAADDGIGLYNDSACLVRSTETWLDWIENGGEYNDTGEENALAPMPEAWKTAPIGGEVSSELDISELLTDRLDETLSLFRRSHTAWIGPHGFAKVDTSQDEDLAEGMENLMKTIGYRLYVSQLSLEGTRAEITFSNAGICPFYFDWQVEVLAVYADGSRELLTPENFSITSVLPDCPASCVVEVGKHLSSLWIALKEPDGDGVVTLCMDAQRSDGYTLLYSADE